MEGRAAHWQPSANQNSGSSPSTRLVSAWQGGESFRSDKTPFQAAAIRPRDKYPAAGRRTYANQRAYGPAGRTFCFPTSYPLPAFTHQCIHRHRPTLRPQAFATRSEPHAAIPSAIYRSTRRFVHTASTALRLQLSVLRSEHVQPGRSSDKPLATRHHNILRERSRVERTVTHPADT